MWSIPAFGDDLSDTMAKLLSIVAGLVLATMLASVAFADTDISAQSLLGSWKGEDPGMRLVAEVIASAFASGFSWGGDSAGKPPYCGGPHLKGAQIMTAFEAFLQDNPSLAEQPYGAAMAKTLVKAFPCGAL
jgi:hypothetical protein